MKVIVITGTSRGLGKAIAQCLLDQTHFVYGISSGPSSIEHSNYVHVQQDLSSPNAPQEILQALTHDHIDSFIHNAGILQISPILDLGLDELEKTMNVNVFSIIGILKLLIPKMRSGSSIVLVSSGAAVKPYAGWGSYCISKAALNMLAGILAQEHPEVCTVAIRPGVVDTDMQSKIRAEGNGIMPAEAYDKFVTLKANGELLDPKLPAGKIAEFAINPLITMNGMFLNWDECMNQ